MEYVIFTLLWIIWCTLHSALISLTVTNYLKYRLGTGFRFYRICFNIFSLATVTPLFLWHPTEPFFTWDGYFVIGKIFIYLIGTFLAVAGGLQYDILHFVGIRQIREKSSHTLISEVGELNTRGILGIIRHPWYSAAFIFFWVSDLGTAEIIRNVILDSYIVIGVYLEERKLVAELGDKYWEYQRQVPMMIQCKWPRRQKEVHEQGN